MQQIVALGHILLLLLEIYINCIVFQKWNYQEVCAVMDEKQDSSLLWAYGSMHF